ncbi:MAG: hypothetical protein A2315_06170 [Ignavibacteria bacterium RIFOXYB2_FULL_35_12]|nr:MAG: hypothetical protein A2X60_11325 [Ignavibacteria bacterium GWF2_35_20]OGU80546.1 MAG: hypothetical protein A2254_04180 [Ignavibacteria bacterium RIFOXYA2_FULL_35_9]OGU83975.1 MAG: hypothetical protein A3K31_17790 [Ignavibacteria bacterium RIFOXYA12_FULL_35_25]OGU92536.1 MAG: hypothetical protein A2492_05740 [Ignavibacteria bacterium RIFOXYC12_FULL_35_11]OGU93449.1 MAG: hypothetical protein A2347_11700 [Ignavibacteria bacterium RIFOXYB12_FULL_35_14]OGV00809.1 MAG: hypothetical protein A
MNKIILVSLFWYPIALGQNLKLGFDLEAHQIRVSTPNNEIIMGGNGAPLSYHLNFSIEVLDPLIVQFKVGRTLHVEFRGWEFGTNVTYKLFEPIFLKFGALQHSNEGGGGSNTFTETYASIFMFHFGFGLEVTEFLSIGLDYYIPTSKKVIVWQGLFDKEPQTFKKMIRLGFNFGWDI